MYQCDKLPIFQCGDIAFRCSRQSNGVIMIRLHTTMHYVATGDLCARPGPWFNKMSSDQDRRSHCGDKTAVTSSYLHNGISCSGWHLYIEPTPQEQRSWSIAETQAPKAFNRVSQWESAQSGSTSLLKVHCKNLVLLCFVVVRYRSLWHISFGATLSDDIKIMT